MSRRHRQNDLMGMLIAKRAFEQRQQAWLRLPSVKGWFETAIAVARVDQGIDRWEDDGGPCRDA